MLDTLVYGEDGNVARPAEASVVKDRLKTTHYLRRTVGGSDHTLHEVGAWEVEHRLVYGGTLVFEERFTALAH